MKISNLRKEHKGGKCFLKCDMEASFTAVKEIWFSVNEKYEDWLTADVYDPFLVAAIYPAMYYKEDITIDGEVSERLCFNVRNYVQDIILAFHPEMRKAKVTVNGFKIPAKLGDNVGTGFSAGVDSFTTFYDHYEKEIDEKYKISVLFFFNVGSHGGGGEVARMRFENRYNYLSSFPKSIGMPYIGVDSNLFDIYLNPWESPAGALCRACAILLFQRKVSKYFAAGSNSYQELFWFPFKRNVAFREMTFYDVYLNPLLSTESLEIIDDGNKYSRSEKIKRIIDYAPVRQYLNVCVNHEKDHLSAKNCSMCPKCLRTLIALEALHKLDEYSDIFDIRKYKEIRFLYKCKCLVYYKTDEYAKDNVDFAKAHGVKMPSRAVANIYYLLYRIRRKICHLI